MPSVVVACNLPAGLQVDQGGITLRINGSHVGVDVNNLPRNGALSEAADRIGAYGLTTFDGAEADALDAWWKAVTEAPDGKPLQHPFAPIASGSLLRFKSEKDARQEVSKDPDMALGGLDPKKDLPPGLESADAKQKG